MYLTFAHYLNRFCMYRTYYALAKGIVKPDGFTLDVIEVPDPPSHEQEELLDVLKQRKVDATVLIDQFFFRGEKDPEVRCPYTDGQGWQQLYGFDEMIKHMIAIRKPLLSDHPGIKQKLLDAFRSSLAYSESHLDEIAARSVRCSNITSNRRANRQLLRTRRLLRIPLKP